MVENNQNLSNFIQSNWELLLALDPKLASSFEKALKSKENSKLNSILEILGTKIFVYDKPYLKSGSAEHVVIFVTDTGGFVVARQIAEKLISDQSCKTISFVVDGIALRHFRNWQYRDNFIEFAADEKSALLSLQSLSSTYGQIEKVISTPSTQISAQYYAILNAKKELGAKHLSIVMDGWIGLGRAFEVGIIKDSELEQIDQIICNDQLAKNIVLARLGNFPQEKILVSGTAQVNQLELDRSAEFKTQMQAKYHLNGTECVLLFLGDVSGSFEQLRIQGISPEFNLENFLYTTQAVRLACKQYPLQEFVILVRPHPSDPQKEKLIEFAKNFRSKQKIKIIIDDCWANSVNQSCALADLICSVMSSESFKAPYRNKLGLLLAFEGELGKDAFEQMLNKKALQYLKTSNNPLMINSVIEFAQQIIKHLSK